MPKYKNILFDLDGTIANSYEGITKSVSYAIDKLNKKDKLDIKLKSSSLLSKFIGPPLEYGFKKYCNIKDENIIKKAIVYYRENYNDKAIFDCVLYDGIYEVLETLNKNDFMVFLATAKPKESAEKVIKYLNVDKLLNGVYAATFNGEIKNKEDVLKYAISKENFDVKKSIMIGDRIDDVEGAKSVGMDSIAVKYGFGNEEEFKNANYMVDKPINILDILLNNNI